MKQLENLQAQFQGHVISGDDAVKTSFVGNVAASAQERLGVYYEAYRLRLLEVLRDDFPGLVGLMSAQAFESLGLRYLNKHPSQHPNVRHFGQHLADFLVTDSEVAEQPYLAEMARFELARGLAFNAAEADILTLDELGKLAAEEWPALRMKFHPTLQRSRFTWNVGPIWRAINAEEPIPPPARLEQPESWVVWRRNITVYWRSLNDAEAGAMDAFADGQNFAEVCTVLCEWLDTEEVPATMAGMLNQWVTEGLVTR